MQQPDADLCKRRYSSADDSLPFLWMQIMNANKQNLVRGLTQHSLPVSNSHGCKFLDIRRCFTGNQDS